MEKAALARLVEDAIEGTVPSVREQAALVASDDRLKWDRFAGEIRSASGEFLSASKEYGDALVRRDEDGDRARRATRRRLDRAETALRSVLRRFRDSRGLIETRAPEPRPKPEIRIPLGGLVAPPRSSDCAGCGAWLERGEGPWCAACSGRTMNPRRRGRNRPF